MTRHEDPAEQNARPPTLLITAGPTQEPIDAVRYLGNRSSGRLGIALAGAARARGWRTILLLGPTPRRCEDTQVEVHRFRTTAELGALLDAHWPEADALIMAAAVADFRPALPETGVVPGSIDPAEHKIRRRDGALTIHLEPTPDLLAKCAETRRPGQVIVGFALEPRDRMLESARTKLERKGADMIVANPLETMDAETIEATLVRRGGAEERTPGAMEKSAFAEWLLERVEQARVSA